MRRWIPIAALGGALLATPARADDGAAAKTTTSGAVVRIDGDDVYLDLTRDEVRHGTELRIYRKVVVRHPVTGRKLEDRFVIGLLKVAQAGASMSLAHPMGTPSHPLAVGDVVEGAAAPEAPSPAERGEEQAPEPPSPAEAEVVQAWRATLGRPPAARMAVWKQYLARNPDSPYADAVRDEIGAMRYLAEHPPSPPSADALRAQAKGRLASSVRGQPLTRTTEGRPTEIALTFDPDGPVRSLLLYVRPSDPKQAYEKVPMHLDGNGHGRATVPEAVVVPPRFDYFVVAVGDHGTSAPVMGRADHPRHVQVEPEGRAEAEGPPRSRVRLSTDVASFHGKVGDDWLVITEGDFLYRVLAGPLYGVRVGYGHFHGEGAPLSVLDAGGPTEVAAFTYGYFELELQLHRLFAVMARATVGLGQLGRDVGQESGLRGGFQLRLRIGPERGTNLVLAGETIPEIGQRAYLALHWEAIEAWPMGAEVEVTDQPVNSGDLAVRGVLEAGRRFADVATLSARVSFQGRRIEHAGFGAGLALTFDF